VRPIPRQRLHLESSTLTVGEAVRALARAARPERAPAAILEAYEGAWGSLAGGQAIAVASGRGAIALALRMSGVGEGDDVVVTGFTCVAVPIAARMVGATVQYADVDGSTGNVSPRTVESALTPRTRAVVVQHFLGNPAPVAAVRAIVPSDVVVIEDAVHAFGSRQADGRLVGGAADWAVFGTEQSKPLSTGQGGVLVAVSSRAAAATAHLAGLPRWSTARTRRWLLRIGLDRLAAALAAPLGASAAEVAHRLVHRAGLSAVSSADELESGGHAPLWRQARLSPALAEIGLEQLRRRDGMH